MTDSFKTTRWSIIDNARGDQQTVRRDALDQLLTCYMPVLRAHLVRHKRLSPDLADELLQDFVVKNIVGGHLVERADASAGKFRSWLLKWLDIYVRHHFSRTRQTTAIDEYELGSAEVETDAFDADWARATLAEAIELMKRECVAEGKENRWEIFQQRMLLPLLSDAEPTDYEILVPQLKLKSKAQAQNHLVSAKRHFQRSLETVIARYAETDDEITDEIVELRRVLSSAKSSPMVFARDHQQSLSPQDITNIVEAAPERLAKLYELDLAAVWQRCLDTRIGNLLDDAEGVLDAEMTLREFFQTADPFEELLIRLKELGNSTIQKESCDLPVDIGLAIYLTSIATAQVRLGKWISQASAEILRPAFGFLRRAKWIDAESLAIHEQALSRDFER